MRHKEAGMTLVELLIVIAIMGLVATIAVPIYRGAIDKSHRATLVHDAGELYRAFMRYNVDKGYFPSTANPVERKFDVETLAPLSTEQYFRTVEAFVRKLENGQIQNYDSPNIGAADTQFWATINSAREPGYVMLVAHTNDLPFDRGTWYDGVYYVTSDGLVEVKETK